MGTAQGKPSKTSWCSGNVDDSTKCSACMNWGLSTKIGAREFASEACANKVTNTVTDCLYYFPTISSTKSTADCMKCNNKTWINMEDNATAANIKLACSDTAVDTTNCATAVSNCAQSVCYKPSGTKKMNQANTGGLYPTCAQATITNAAIGHMLDNTMVYTCATGFAVANNQLSCVAFTADANCRRLGTGNTYCADCKDSYYFDGTTCTLSAKLMSFAAIVMAALYLM